MVCRRVRKNLCLLLLKTSRIYCSKRRDQTGSSRSQHSQETYSWLYPLSLLFIYSFSLVKRCLVTAEFEWGRPTWCCLVILVSKLLSLICHKNYHQQLHTKEINCIFIAICLCWYFGGGKESWNKPQKQQTKWNEWMFLWFENQRRWQLLQNEQLFLNCEKNSDNPAIAKRKKKTKHG